MSTYEELEKEFQEKVNQLRAKCKHPKISDWTEEWWAIGHPTGYFVKVCLICRKEVERK